MRTHFYFIFTLILGISGHVMAMSCFSDHLHQSIRINRQILGRYHELTGGKSDAILNKMIAGEKVSLLVASALDNKAQIYHKKGIDLFCQEFKEMKYDESEIELRLPQVAPLKISSTSFVKELKKAIRTGDEKVMKAKSLEVLIELNKSPDHHCFARHIIESIFRFAYFVPQRKFESSQKKLRDPKRLLIKMMKLQLMALPFAHYIDRKSIPIQKLGIPLLCRDLPNLIEDIPVSEIEFLKNPRKDYGKN